MRARGGSAGGAWTVARWLAELAGFAALFFLTRFVARGYLVPQMDQECHIGGIAVDVLTHGVRFPLLAYAPNEYDNGSFFSGLLAALSFTVLGRRLLALKLVTHLISAAGAVATLSLLRGCLDDLGLGDRRVRRVAIAVLVIALALGPLMVAALSMYAVGNHAEGTAIDMLLLALFAARRGRGGAAAAAASWCLVGLALYLNKGTFLVIPLLALAEAVLARRAWRQLAAAAAGFALGIAPELWVIVQRHGMGWATMAGKAERTAPAFPRAFVEDLLTLADYRGALLAVWGVALVAGTFSLRRAAADARRLGGAPPLALALVVGVVWLHLAALTVMAQGGFDAYAMYGYPPLVVLYALLVAGLVSRAVARPGIAGAAVGLAAVALTAVLYRPVAMAWDLAPVAALWRNQAGAACSWRFAEGFEREQQYRLAPAGQSREQHAIARCRTLSDELQVLDCIGGIARELHWRRGGHITGEPPPELRPAERRAYAYYYGTHRKGDAAACDDFADPGLRADCAAAVRLECLLFADAFARMADPAGLGPPHCAIPEPPMDGFWAQMRRGLLARPPRAGAPAAREGGEGGEGELRACQPVIAECYAAPPA